MTSNCTNYKVHKRTAWFKRVRVACAVAQNCITECGTKPPDYDTTYINNTTSTSVGCCSNSSSAAASASAASLSSRTRLSETWVDWGEIRMVYPSGHCAKYVNMTKKRQSWQSKRFLTVQTRITIKNDRQATVQTTKYTNNARLGSKLKSVLKLVTIEEGTKRPEMSTHL